MASTSKTDAQITQRLEPADKNGKVIKSTHRERRFHRLFRNVPTTEVLLNRFSCAFVSDIGLLLQGHMYISNDWICFHSNIFGIEKIIEIPVHSIVTVCKARTAKIIPNAVCIKTKTNKQYFFGSLLSRDTTHHLLSSVLSRFHDEQHHQTNHAAAMNISEDDNHIDHHRALIINSDNNNNCANDEIFDIQLKVPDNKIANGPVSTVDVQTSTTSDLDTVRDILVENSSHSSSSGDSSDDDSADDQMDKTAKANLAPRSKGKSPGAQETAFPKNIFGRLKYGYEMTLLSFVNWFSNLPKLLMFLIACVVLLALLFLFATVLTMRLIYFKNPQISVLDFISLGNDGKKLDLDPAIFDKMHAIVENSVKLVEDVKRQLTLLSEELVKESTNLRATNAAKSQAQFS